MINPPLAQRHPLAGSSWLTQPHTLTEWLNAQDQQPQALIEWLNQQPTQRLGRYYEQLWGYALTHAPGIRLIARNWVIQGPSQTLGELDVLFEDAQGIHHLELAVKFYLAPLQQPQDLHQWRGPASHDTLGAKLSHLACHQLRLSENPMVHERLRALGIQSVSSSAWLGGMLFNATAMAQGSWPRWQYHQPLSDQPWIEVPKLGWLSPMITEHLPAFAQDPTRVQMVARLKRDNGRYVEAERRLLVPTHWPERR